MKTLLYSFLALTLIIVGCQRENRVLPLLHTAEACLSVDVDSAVTLLDSIAEPDKLDDETFARWCMLCGKITDETATGLLPLYQWKRAQQWFTQHGTAEEQAQIALYLGRAYVEDGEYDKAMEIYAEALESAKKHKAYNIAGYICTYMADLYSFRNVGSECLKKREEANDFFKKAENHKSYAYGLKDLACEWALIDSFASALSLLQKAESISQSLYNKDLTAATANAFGLVYKMQGNYEKAEKYFLKAIDTDSEESFRDSVALLHIYIESGQLAKAHKIIEAVTKDNNVCYNINEAYYLLYKAEKKYKEALHYKEICSDILDSLTTAQNKTKVLETEKKYNNTTIREENELLKITQQRNVILIVITISLFLLSVAAYIIYWQRTKAKIYRQQTIVDKMKIELLHISMELEEKKRALQVALSDKEEYAKKLKQEIDDIFSKYSQLQKQKENAEAKIYQQREEVNNMKIGLEHLSMELEEKKQALQSTLTDKEESVTKLRKEIEVTVQKYNQLQRQQLETSTIGKKLISLTQKNKIEKSQILSSDKVWRSIMIEVDKIYPKFYSLLNEACPNLTEQELQYCYLHIFRFDTNDEAKLLGINPDSVRIKRSRINQKLQKDIDPKASMQNYLIKYLLK